MQKINSKERYLFIGKVTKHVTQSSPLNLIQSLNVKSNKLETKKKTFDLSFVEQHKVRKKSAYLLAKNKVIQKKSQTRLF